MPGWCSLHQGLTQVGESSGLVGKPLSILPEASLVTWEKVVLVRVQAPINNFSRHLDSIHSSERGRYFCRNLLVAAFLVDRANGR